LRHGGEATTSAFDPPDYQLSGKQAANAMVVALKVPCIESIPFPVRQHGDLTGAISAPAPETCKASRISEETKKR